MKKLRRILTLALALATLTSCGLVRRTDAPDSPGTGGAGRDTDAPTAVSPENTETVSADDPAVTNVPEKRLSFLGCGDNIVYYGNVREAAAVAVPGGRQYNFAPTYTFVADMIKNADISFINQETLMCGDGWEFSYYPMFNGPQDMGHDLVDLGYDVVGVANNHMLDKGGDGLEATIAFWKSQDVLMIGGYMCEEEYTHRILERDDVRIAFLSYTYGTNGLTLYPGYEVVIPYLDEQTVERQIKAARADADLVIVSVHWGVEGQFTPTEEQRKYAKIMNEAGADVILGHHPHVIEPVEWLTSSGGRRTLCVYSLGNFIGEQAYDYNMVGGMISFDIVSNGSWVYVENPVFIPTVYYFDSSFYSNCIYPMTQFTEALASSHGIGSYGNYTSLEKLQKYVTDTIDPEFLPDEFKAQVGLD